MKQKLTLEQWVGAKKRFTDFSDIPVNDLELAVDGYTLGQLRAILVYPNGLHIIELANGEFEMPIDRGFYNSPNLKELESELFSWWTENVN